MASSDLAYLHDSLPRASVSRARPLSVSLPRIGVDAGAVAVKTVVLADSQRRPRVIRGMVPAGGDVRAAIIAALRQVSERLGATERPAATSVRLAVTGQGRSLLSDCPGVHVENEILALARAMGDHGDGSGSGTRTLVEVGGHAARWLVLDPANAGALEAFEVNDQCAAGAGAFIEQQAGRLGLSVDDFAALARDAASGAAIAGRCAVFAKSDMIHLQQKGTPVDEIAYGLCLALARNFVATVVRGRECPGPIGLAGGGARNAGLVRAFREVLDDDGVAVVAEPLHTCALGAAMAAQSSEPVELEAVIEHLEQSRPRAAPRSVLPALEAPRPVRPRPAAAPRPSGPVDAWLGVDVGSVSTDFALLSPGGELLDGIYLRTRGRPLDVLREGLQLLRERHGDRLRVLGLGTTGSGRYLAGRLLGADLIKNEITAQMAGALHYFPDADTIFEIGGQDSKYIRVENGVLADFTMNKVCAAGTGSFLEEQCGLLGLDVREDFSRLALLGSAPAELGTRCTVFMEAELVHARARGVGNEDATAGLALSVVRNYLQKVVGNRPVGRRVVFQGGVAANRAVVAAFAQVLGRCPEVHPQSGLSGAVGAALLVREARRGCKDATAFRGLGAIRDVEARTFECRHCSNRCEVARVSIGSATVHFGDTCERFTSKDGGGQPDAGGRPLEQRRPAAPNLLARWEEMLARAVEEHDPGERRKGVIGIPRASSLIEYLPFWAALFGRLGWSVHPSQRTSMRTLRRGGRHITAETCLPVKAAIGHVAQLADEGVDHVLVPSAVCMEDAAGEAAAPCPYTQALPYMAGASLAKPLLVPEVPLTADPDGFVAAMRETAATLGAGVAELRDAFEYAWGFQRQVSLGLQELGRSVLESSAGDVLLLLGRPYNLGDPFLNLSLAKHLERMGVPAIPQVCVPPRAGDPAEAGRKLPWRFPRDAARAALRAVDDPRLHTVLVTNYGCGPDAFLQRHLSDLLGARPLLVLEFDEQRGEAGMVTRLEAFLDRIASPGTHRLLPCGSGPSGPGSPDACPGERPPVSPAKAARSARLAAAPPARTSRVAADSGSPARAARTVPAAARPRPPLASPEDFAGRRVFVPRFSDHAFAFEGALRFLGADAGVLPEADDGVRIAGEEASSGKECHAFVMFTGDLVRLAERPESDGAVYFYPGTRIPCLLTQFGEGMRLVLRERGIGHLDVTTPSTADYLTLFGLRGGTQLWRGLVAADLLVRWLCHHRPYEVVHGSADEVHSRNLLDLSASLAADDMGGFLDRSLARMDTVKVERRPRPLVGIAGDIYTRVCKSANEDLWRRLESLGCEVWPAPFLVDHVDFGFRHSLGKSLARRRFQDAFQFLALLLRKDLAAWRIRRRLSARLCRGREPGYREILDNATRYVGPASQEVLLLNVSKMVDFARGGAHGIINAMCHNCMFGTASASLTTELGRDHGGIPITTLVYTGTGSAAREARLETFVHQVHAFHERPARSAWRPAEKRGYSLR